MDRNLPFPPLPPLPLPPPIHCPLYWLRKGWAFHGKAYHIKLPLRLRASPCIQAGPGNLVGGKVFQKPAKTTGTDLLPLLGVSQTHQAPQQLSHICQEGLGPIQFHPGILATGSDSEFP